MNITGDDLAALLDGAKDFDDFKNRVAKLRRLKEREQKINDAEFDWHAEQDSLGQD